MTDEKLCLVVMAGLVHDVGKLLERGELFRDARNDPQYLTCCPEDRKKKHPTHLHAVHTAAFCDWLEKRFSCLRNLPDKDWKTWCAAHHRNDEKGKEASVIRISDRLSSGERDEGDYYRKEIHRKTLLEPVLERVRLKGTPDCLSTRWRYPLVRLTSKKDSLFPVRGTEVRLNGNPLGLKEMDGAEKAVEKIQWRHLVATDKAPVVEAYQKLGEGLLADIDALSEKQGDMELPDLIVTLTTLLERYTVNVPSAANLRHPDISLFDHLRTTAAIAQSLYLQFEHEGDFKVEMGKDDPTSRWLLVCGDFSGIQKFIYNLTNKGAAKGLRGRSFYVSHFCRVCADYLLRELELTRAALLYNSGGKFYLLIPAFMKQRLYDIRKKVNSWLLNHFGGDVFFGLGVADVSAGMFERGKMDDAWETAALNLEADRLKKFNEQFGEDGFFDPQTKINPILHCRVCGSPKLVKDQADDKCKACADMENLGRAISDTEAILTLWGNPEDANRLRKRLDIGKEKLFSFSELNCHCLLVSGNSIPNLRNAVFNGECAFLNDHAERDFSDLPLPGCAVSALYLGKWDKHRQSKEADGYAVPWEFDDYADHSKGICRLGILRMDVDNLGMIFINGLHFPRRGKEGWGSAEKEGEGIRTVPMASISRMVTLSRQLNHFFSGYLPELMKSEADFNQCQIIYAGGDDLFIIGSWHQLPKLAETVRAEFMEFCCKNPAFSISGGLILQRGKYPIYKGAQLAGAAEKEAKEKRKHSEMSDALMKKDGFSFLGVPILWEDFDFAKAVKSMMEADFKNNRGLLSFLTQMTANNKSLVQSRKRKKGLSESQAWKEIAFESWRWRTAYQLRRRYGKKQSRIEEWSNLLFGNQMDEQSSALPVFTWLEMPLRWTEFLNRDKGGK